MRTILLLVLSTGVALAVDLAPLELIRGDVQTVEGLAAKAKKLGKPETIACVEDVRRPLAALARVAVQIEAERVQFVTAGQAAFADLDARKLGVAASKSRALRQVAQGCFVTGGVTDGRRDVATPQTEMADVTDDIDLPSEDCSFASCN